MKILWNQEIYHYGTKGHSGRYPPGSGENPKTGPRAGRPSRKVRRLIRSSEKASKRGNYEKAGRKLFKAIEEQKLNTHLDDAHSQSTGENYDKASKRLHRKLNYVDKKYSVDKSGLEKLNERRYKNYLTDVDKVFADNRRNLAKAQLKDIGYQDIKKGMRILNTYKTASSSYSFGKRWYDVENNYRKRRAAKINKRR